LDYRRVEIMRLLIIAAVLLSTGPSLASPRHPTPAQWRDIHKFGDAAAYCANHRTGEGGGEVGKTKINCDIEDRLGKKLEAQGFCLYAKGGVGRTGKLKIPPTGLAGERHCYTIHDPGDH
jgi:hypothetical protein